MDAQKLIVEITKIFFNTDLNDDDTAGMLLDLLDENRETVQFDKALRKAHRYLNIWSRTEKDTGYILDQVHKVLQLKKPKLK